MFIIKLKTTEMIAMHSGDIKFNKALTAVNTCLILKIYHQVN